MGRGEQRTGGTELAAEKRCELVPRIKHYSDLKIASTEEPGKEKTGSGLSSGGPGSRLCGWVPRDFSEVPSGALVLHKRAGADRRHEGRSRRGRKECCE